MKKILVLGGTSFLGRVLVEELLKTGHLITLFNRGKSNRMLFPEARKLFGDRLTDDIRMLGREQWDVVIDLSCFHPVHLEKQLHIMKGNIGRYIFVSSISALAMDEHEMNMVVDETTPLLACTEDEKQSADVMATYGQKKAECERIVLENDWMDSITFRPSLIYGRYDPTDRLYYWLRKVKMQDTILVPENGERLLAMTYVEDLARAMCASITVERHLPAYNTGTHTAVTLHTILENAGSNFGVSPTYLNASAEYLMANNVGEWVEMPLWINGGDMVISTANFFRDFSWEHVRFDESIRRTIAYYNATEWRACNYGMSDEREQELLAKLIPRGE